jgi:(E)-2-((N-methylformamido)methylene)succinate hydrolase
MSTSRVVLLHGVGLDHTMWQPVRSRLPQDFGVTAPDLLGHGASRPAPAGTTLADLAEHVLHTVENPAHFVGFSLGALVAQHIAIHQPEMVATLTCVSSVCDRTDKERWAVMHRLREATRDFAGSVEASLQRWYAGTEVDPSVIEQTKATLLRNDQDSYLACYRIFATADEQLAPLLGRIHQPSLAITGGDDPGSTPDMAHRLATHMPGCTAVVVPGVRHMLPVQAPDDLSHELISFIEGTTP